MLKPLLSRARMIDIAAVFVNNYLAFSLIFYKKNDSADGLKKN
jgi:hypothetical protein